MKIQTMVNCLVMGAILGACGAEGSEDEASEEAAADGKSDEVTGTDPGTSAWEVVPRDQVLERCGLDPDLLEAADDQLDTISENHILSRRRGGTPWAIVRHGLLCHVHLAENSRGEAFSATKTFGAMVTGMVAYQTRNLENTGPKTGPLSDTDKISHWLDEDDITYNKDAVIADVLSMVAHSPDLSAPRMNYDVIGSVQINSLSDVLTTAVRQGPLADRIARNLEQFTQRYVYAPLGMTSSRWSSGLASKNFAWRWNTDVLDMARVGLLLLNKGEWSGERLLSEDWVYRMTHPSFEQANTAYGYLTWLNADSNYHFGSKETEVVEGEETIHIDETDEAKREIFHEPTLPGPCAPVAVHPEYPPVEGHGLSESPDCNYEQPYSCEQEFDVGVWNAVGSFGQVIQGHPGLDMVIIGRNLDPNAPGTLGPAALWDAVRPAVVAADPTFAGDEEAFCQAYGSNSYAPDLR